MPATLLILILLVSLVPSSLTELSNTEEKWEEFKASYDKSYENNEEPLRHQIFKNNLELIELNNKRFENNESTYKLGINKFADVSLEEFQSSLKLFKDLINTDRLNSVKHDFDTDDDDAPESMDWRMLGAVTDVKDEKIYYEGFSWAFSVAGAFEAQVYLALGTLIPLSAQQLIDCADPTMTSEYFFGMLDFAYLYVANQTGILTEEEYPYNGQKDTCHKKEAGISCGLIINLGDEYDMRDTIGNESPVTAVIDASRLANYVSGIIDNTLCNNEKDDVNHAVLVVGYGTENDVDYWLLKNSWGADWGEDGYFRVKRFDNNTCGIAWSATYPWINH